jgi:aminopeptidase S
MRRAAVVVLVALLAAAPASAGPISGKRAKAYVAKLAAAGPRPAGSANERRAAGLVAKRLKALGYVVQIQTFRLPNGRTSRNVVGRTTWRTRALVGAHMDGVRAGPAANDNGSGLAALLEVASALRGRPGVLVAALGAEERVVTGSSIHLGSRRLMSGFTRKARGRIRVALVMDMVGFGRRLHVRGLEASPNRSSRNALARAKALGFRATYLRDPSGQSDHAEMTRAGLPAGWLEWREDPCWHSACDRAGRVKGWKIAQAAQIVAAAAKRSLG